MCLKLPLKVPNVRIKSPLLTETPVAIMRTAVSIQGICLMNSAVNLHCSIALFVHYIHYFWTALRTREMAFVVFKGKITIHFSSNQLPPTTRAGLSSESTACGLTPSWWKSIIIQFFLLLLKLELNDLGKLSKCNYKRL